jgi:hypothetical protein
MHGSSLLHRVTIASPRRFSPSTKISASLARIASPV